MIDSFKDNNLDDTTLKNDTETEDSESSNNTESNKATAIIKEIFSWIIPLLISVLTVFLIVNFVARPVLVNGSSMSPTLETGDRLITIFPYGGFKHGDIVILKKDGMDPLIKRVIAVGGDKVDIDYTTNSVYVNDEKITEDYILEPMREPIAFKSIPFPQHVEEGKVLVMGDNRNNSDDSRDVSIGLIDEKDIFGIAKFRFWPFKKFGTVK